MVVVHYIYNSQNGSELKLTALSEMIKRRRVFTGYEKLIKTCLLDKNIAQERREQREEL